MNTTMIGRSLGVVGAVLSLLVAGCATTPPSKAPTGSVELSITSDPTNALVFIAEEKEGPWTPYQRETGAHVTPSRSKIAVGEWGWIKVSKDGVGEAEPKFFRAESNQPITLDFILTPFSQPTQPEAPSQAALSFTSEPVGALVEWSDQIGGPFKPWSGDAVGSRTPLAARAELGARFWVRAVPVDDAMRKAFDPSEAREVVISSAAPQSIHLLLKAKPVVIPPAPPTTPGPAPKPPAPAERVSLMITSNPVDATILIAPEEFGRYAPFADGGRASGFTPLNTEIEVGKVFWVKLSRDKYDTSSPVLVRAERGKPIRIHIELKASDPLRPDRAPTPSPLGMVPGGSGAMALAGMALQMVMGAPDPGDVAVLSQGFAPLGEDKAAARRAAIVDALRNAVEEHLGGTVESASVLGLLGLSSDRVEALAQGKFASYTLLSEEERDGLYQVKLRVSLQGKPEDILSQLTVSFIVGGLEETDLDPEDKNGKQTRSALGDALMDTSLGVTLIPEPVGNQRELVTMAEANGSDFALYVKSRSRQHDQLGNFYSYKTTVEFDLLMPATDDLVASGRIDGYNKERQLDARDAAEESQRDTGAQVAEEVLKKIRSRYDKAAMHDFFVKGLPTLRDVERLVIEARKVPEVREARLLSMENDVCHIQLWVQADVRSDMPLLIQRFANMDLDIVESTPYFTVAKVR